ncbi:MAG: hypothetical protein GX222_08640 [Ruminococcaceae bacterium]|nr:hypothetical protein [Oscillospiraceae bacterium]
MKIRKIIGLLVLLSLMGILCGCANSQEVEKHSSEQSQTSDMTEQSQEQDLPEIVPKFSAWAVYWDFDNLKSELEAIKDDLISICFFEVFYDEAGKFVVPEELEEIRTVLGEVEFDEAFHTYLTFVNDFKLQDGGISNKDLSRTIPFFETESDAQNHADKIVSLTKELGYDGVEIDYEALGKTDIVWDNYLMFLEELRRKCEEQQLMLKVVLEPNAPFHKDFPENIEYVVMCYNLYGGHSGMGPKATPEFIKELIGRAGHISEKVSFAIATGGFDWRADGKTTALTQRVAESLSLEHEAKVVRDDESGCMVFEYTDEDNMLHTVWYADVCTLQKWTDTIRKESPKSTVSIWRLNGNSDLDQLE